jgi:hypothetical protein
MPVLVSVLQMLILVVGKVEPPYRRPAHVSWSARGQAGSQKRWVPTLHLLYFSMIGQRWRSVYYYFPAQLYGIETAKCKKTAIVVQLHRTPEADRREGDQAGNFRKSKQRGSSGYGNEWTRIVIILSFRFHLVGSPCSHIFVQTIQR